MASFLNRARFALGSAIMPYTPNKYREAFMSLLGGGFAMYDVNGKTYIEQGYQKNPDIYAIISQKARKAASIPIFVKKVEDKQSRMKLGQLQQATKGVFTPQQIIKAIRLRTKAYNNEELLLPLDKPNALQTWTQIIDLYETFMSLTGNFYLYMECPEDGMNKGVPIAVYVLPSHLMEIVPKKDAQYIRGDENPIDHYRLVEGRIYTKFEAENVIHVKYSNPDYNQSGSQLYGQSPLLAALKNIQSSNEALANNIKTLANSGIFGLLSGKNGPGGTSNFTSEQALALTDRLKELDKSPERLAKMAATGAEVVFQQIGLSTKDLQPFEYLKYDQEQLNNVLGWSIQLLNQPAGTLKADIINEARRVLIDSLMPDLDLLGDSLNRYYLTRFRGYENTEVIFDYSELPEMQQDMKSLVDWLSKALADGAITRNEYREALRFAKSDLAEMDLFTVSVDLMNIQDAVMPAARDII